MTEIKDLEGVQKKMSSLGGPTLKKIIIIKVSISKWRFTTENHLDRLSEFSLKAKNLET